VKKPLSIKNLNRKVMLVILRFFLGFQQTSNWDI
jgi:hypothetical protein